MSHLRTQIRDAVIEALAGLDTTAGRVYPVRLVPWDQVPRLEVSIPEDDWIEERASMGSHVGWREASLRIEAVSRTTLDVDAELDRMDLEIAQALHADAALAALIRELVWIGTSKAITTGAEDADGSALVSYRIRYVVDASDPQVAED